MRAIIISGFVGLMFQTTIYGWIPEWPKGTDCKSAATCFGGSNPPLPISNKNFFIAYNILSSRGGAVWKLVGLITRRSLVQIHPPQLVSIAYKMPS